LDRSFQTFKIKPRIREAEFLINSYRKIGNLDQAFDVYNTLLRANTKPTPFVLAALLGICKDTDNRKRALQIMEQLDIGNVEVDGVCMKVSKAVTSLL
jgi:pentatricopeptide repeat protein